MIILSYDSYGMWSWCIVPEKMEKHVLDDGYSTRYNGYITLRYPTNTNMKWFDDGKTWVVSMIISIIRWDMI